VTVRRDNSVISLTPKTVVPSTNDTGGIAATANVAIGGVNYPIAFSFNACADTEPYCGANLHHAVQNMAHLSALQLRGLFLAGIRAVDPTSKLTVIDVGKLLTFENISAVTEAIAESILASVPKAA
jgi:hypothetical protein